MGYATQEYRSNKCRPAMFSSPSTKPTSVLNRDEPGPQTGASSAPETTVTKFAVHRDSARTSLPAPQEDPIAAPTNFLSGASSFETLLARKAFAVIQKRAGKNIGKCDDMEPDVKLACSFVRDGCLDLSHLSRGDQVRLCRFDQWGIVYSQAGSLGRPITKLSLPSANIRCKADSRSNACVLLFSEDEALPELDRRLLAMLLRDVAGDALVEYGKVGARELLRISRHDVNAKFALRWNPNFDVIVDAEENTDFFDLAWARECLKRGNALDARLDALSAKQWKEATRQSVAAFGHLIAMPITRDNEEKFVELLKLLADHDSWSACDATCRVEWSKGCERVADTLDQWKGSVGTPTQWKLWTEHSKTLRALLQGKISDTRKAGQELSPGPLATPPEVTDTTAKTKEARKRAVRVTQGAQAVWRGKLVDCCLSDPVDAARLLDLLDKLVESRGWSPDHKRDLLQEEFNGKMLLEHLGDTKTDEYFSLFDRLS
jgi:hypothetical protein